MLTANWVYQLPVGSGRALHLGNAVADYILGNWQVNGIARLRSGQPYTVVLSGDIANTGNMLNFMRPNLVGDPHLNNRSPLQWFNKAAFGAPPVFTFGNAGRNILRSDWVRTFDLSVFRQFPIGERVRVELRGEAFNAFNTPIFGIPITDMNSINFGRVTSAAVGPRQMQLSLKISY